MLFAVTSLSPNTPPSSPSSSSSSDDDDDDGEENKGKKKTKWLVKKKKSIPYQPYKSDATSAVFGRFIVDYYE